MGVIVAATIIIDMYSTKKDSLFISCKNILRQSVHMHMRFTFTKKCSKKKSQLLYKLVRK